MMRRGIVALLLGLPVLLAAVGYAWMRDEPLSADAQTWLEQAQVDEGRVGPMCFSMDWMLTLSSRQRHWVSSG